MTPILDYCANCESPIASGRLHLDDERTESKFCDGQCYREWAEDKGFEKVIAFYADMNVGKVIID